MERRGKRVVFRPTTRADLEEIRTLWNDGRVTQYVGFPDGLGYDTAMIHDWYVALQDNPNSHHFVVRADEVGFCGEVFYRVDRSHRRASLDIKFVPEAQGKGLATEALEQLIQLVFEAEEDVDAVWTEPWPENIASQKLYGRCGMASEPRPIDLGDGPSFWVVRKADWKAR